jgi:rhamnulose-1-phosphate aldolase
MKTARVNNLKDCFNEISDIAFCLWQKGWAEASAGNISINITETYELNASVLEKFPLIKLNKSYPFLKNNYLIITASGSRMVDIAYGSGKYLMILYITEKANEYRISGFSPDGKLIKPEYKPTSELATHLAIHNLIREKGLKEKALLHTHCTELIALTHLKKFGNKKILNKTLFEMHPEVKLFIPAGAGLVNYMDSGTEKIASLTLKEFEKNKIVIWAKHGCLATGKTLTEAFDYIDIVSKAAKIYFTIRNK